jgi:putative ABC transport system substrate-binding protein
MSYGADLAAVHGRAAAYVHRILKGARPADLPVEQPTTFELVVAANTARALGISIAPDLAAQVTQRIQAGTQKPPPRAGVRLSREARSV